jgi:ATP-dependent Lon protease
MVFVGNINQPVDTLVRTSHLFAPFPETMIDSAFFDRFHAYIPGWEIPKMRPEFFTNQYGLIVDYLAEWLREMRKRNFGDAINKFFKLGRDLNQRDSIAVKHTVSGLLKLLYPHEEYDKEAVRRCLEYALEGRRRVRAGRRSAAWSSSTFTSPTSTWRQWRKSSSACRNREADH